MAKFLLLYTGGGMPETEAQQAEVVKAWVVWYDALGEAVVDPGDPFTPMAKNITSSGRVSDGPIGTMGTGYTIIKADSLDSAVEKAKSCPIIKSGGQITVYETFPVM